MSAASNHDVMVMFPGALGDALLFLPALRGLRRRHAGARLHLAVRRVLLPLARLMDVADEHHALDDAALARWLGGGAPPPWWPACPQLYSWFGASDAVVRARLASAASSADFFGVVRDPGGRHAANVYQEAIGAAAEWPATCTAARITPPPSARVAALGAAPGRWLVLHRGAGSPSKCWSRDGFQDVAQRWRRGGGPVFDLLGPAEAREGPLPDAILVREWPLSDVLALLARADAYVGHDSGPSHLAGAAGCRGVVLFGPTEPAEWRPASERLLAMCGAGVDRAKRMASLRADRVYVALGERLNS